MLSYGKKIGVSKTDDSSIKKSTKGAQFEFEFINVFSHDAIMLCLLYLLECDLIGTLKRLSIRREALLPVVTRIYSIIFHSVQPSF